MKPTTTNAAILVIDDDPELRHLMGMVLKREPYTVRVAASLDEGVQCLRAESFDLIVTDLCLGEQSGIDVVKQVKQFCPEAESIVITAFGSIERAVEAIRAGAFDFLAKPFTNEQLVMKVQKAVERRFMRKELMALREHVAMSYGFDNIVGISKVMHQLKETARRIAPTDITVLITGPSGTGKELLARALHHHSNRRNGRFVAIDCSAIPEALLESELFGHVRGSFTSAWANKKGLFEEADTGTVFLDEVSNMTLSTQAKLLRFLNDSEVRQVGSLTSRKVDVRVIAATNKDLKGLVAGGSFREDLYYRLAVIPLYLPPLSERAEDIEILIDYFLRKIGAEGEGKPIAISRAAVEKLISHNWPGNVRELENTLKRGAALCSGRQIEPGDIILIGGERPTVATPVETAGTASVTRGRLLDSGQRTLILRALNDNSWNFTKTAAELGIGRTTLWRKVRKYNLAPAEESAES